MRDLLALTSSNHRACFMVRCSAVRGAGGGVYGCGFGGSGNLGGVGIEDEGASFVATTAGAGATTSAGVTEGLGADVVMGGGAGRAAGGLGVEPDETAV